MDIQRIRRRICEEGCMGFSAAGWDTIEKIFREECGPGEDDIRAALQDLAESRGESKCGLEVVSETGDWLLRWWCSPENLADSIRSLIPKSVPTPKEALDTVESCIDYWPGREPMRPSSDRVRKAVACLRKLVEKT